MLLNSGDSEGCRTGLSRHSGELRFPWARGVARSLHRQNKLSEGAQRNRPGRRQHPHFFDAADLKANICMAQGEHAEAQQILDDVAKKTPRNYQRKRLLAEAATLNGDTETACAIMADVVANDTMPGAVTPEDRLALARSQVDANDLISAKTLVGLKESEMQNLDLDAQASYAALLAISSPGRGKPRFAGLRPAMMSAQLADTNSRLDILRSALTLGDHELADHQAKALLEARKRSGASAQCASNTPCTAGNRISAISRNRWRSSASTTTRRRNPAPKPGSRARPRAASTSRAPPRPNRPGGRDRPRGGQQNPPAGSPSARPRQAGVSACG